MINLDAAGRKFERFESMPIAYIFLHVELALDCVSEEGVRVNIVSHHKVRCWLKDGEFKQLTVV